MTEVTKLEHTLHPVEYEMTHRFGAAGILAAVVCSFVAGRFIRAARPGGT